MARVCLLMVVLMTVIAVIRVDMGSCYRVCDRQWGFGVRRYADDMLQVDLAFDGTVDWRSWVDLMYEGFDAG